MEDNKYKDLFETHQRIHQKICALSNFSETLENFPEWGALELAMSYFKKGQSDPEIEEFLDYLLRKNDIYYLDWAYKTPHLRHKIAERFRAREQLHFFFEDLERKKLEEWRNSPIPSFIKKHEYLRL